VKNVVIQWISYYRGYIDDWESAFMDSQ
jgi:hypothetical protein